MCPLAAGCRSGSAAQRCSSSKLELCTDRTRRRDLAVCCFVRLLVFPKPLTSPLKLLWPNKCDLALIISLRQVGIVRGVFPFRPSPLPPSPLSFSPWLHLLRRPRQEAATSQVLNITPMENQTVTKITWEETRCAGLFWRRWIKLTGIIRKQRSRESCDHPRLRLQALPCRRTRGLNEGCDSDTGSVALALKPLRTPAVDSTNDKRFPAATIVIFS